MKSSCFSARHMRYMLSTLVLGLWASCSPPPPAGGGQTGIRIIPKPNSIVMTDGEFRMTEETSIEADGELLAQAELLRGFLSPASGYALPVNVAGSGKNIIQLKLAKDLSSGDEGYELRITPDGVLVTAPTSRGIVWGIQTMRQLFPTEILRDSQTAGVEWSLPCLTIIDAPRFSWRGLMIDYSRTFWNKEITKKYIDALSFYKMNNLHMHLTDDQGWRLEISKYPALTETGSKFDPSFRERPEHEGFYTKEDIRELLQYAGERNVELIPEIEMPGHALAAIAAYPKLSCTGEKVVIHPFTMGPGVHEEVFCPGKESTFRFIEDVLGEVIELFPSPYVHIGGDEVPKTKWKACPDCQKAIRQNGLKDEEELQSWFIRRVEKILNARGKKLIGWDEITEGGLSPTATVMFWRGSGDGTTSWSHEGLLQSIIRANDVIMSPTSHCYFDYSYETTPTNRVYGLQPVPGGASPEEAARILGVQANFWSHLDRTEPRMDRQIFPRLLALAEVGWSDEKKEWDEFTTRLKEHYEALNLLKIKEVWIELPTFTMVPFPSGDSVEISFRRNDPAEGATVRYTLDGSAPNSNSPELTGTTRFAIPFNFRAGMFFADAAVGTETSFGITEAFRAPVHLKNEPSSKYGGSGATLTDGILGGMSFTNGTWIGFEGEDCEAVLDLGSRKTIQEISLGYLVNAASWIFEPIQIVFEVSADGKQFSRVDRWTKDPKSRDQETRVGRYTKPFQPVEARYVKVTARNPGTCPPNHPGKGSNAWIFLDEILVR